MANTIEPTPSVDPRVFIEDLRKKNGPNYQVANTINMAVLTSFLSQECAIKEILQNANDQAKDFADISFTLLGNELLISHNGKPFDQEDVRKICDYADVDQNAKGGEDDKTGYKNMGFKSIFRLVRRVIVLSGSWRFHFDETKWPQDGKRYAWQIAPFWCEDSDLSSEAKKRAAMTGTTSFICQLRDPEEAAGILRTFVGRPENILFLTKIQKVLFSINGTSFELKRHQDCLSVNGQIKSRWKPIACTEAIDRIIQISLLETPAYICPKRLKGKEKVSFTLCYEESDGKVSPTAHGRLFSTLATEGSSGLPFHVDAPFFLNPSREALLPHSWNLFLIEIIARKHFEHMKEFFVQSRPTALSVLAPCRLSNSLISEEVRRRFEATIETLIKNEGFLPAHNGTQLLKVREAVIDPTGFYRSLYQAGLSCPLQNLVHLDVDHAELSARFSQDPFKDHEHIKIFTQGTIIGSLPTMMAQREVSLCLQILSYFSTIYRNRGFSLESWNQFLVQPFVLNSRNELCSLSALYLPLEKDIALPEGFNVLHPQLATPAILAWLRELQLPSLNPQQIINHFKTRLHDPILTNKDTNIKIISLFFNLLLNKMISPHQLEELKGIWLLVKSPHLLDSNLTYMSNDYAPQYKLEDHLAGDAFSNLFLSPDYMKQHPADPLLWRQFFVLLGVHENCDFHMRPSISPQKLRQIPDAFIEDYIQDIFNEKNPKKPIQNRNETDPHDTLYPFAGFPFIARLNQSPSFAAHFWQKLQENQESILTYYAQTTYHAYRTKGQPQLHTYLQYVCRNQRIILANDNQYYSSQALYAPSMQLAILPDVRKAVLPVALSPQMEAFLGFKTTVDAVDCERILRYLSTLNYEPRIYEFVMKQIFLNLKNGDAATRTGIAQWPFRATNREWRYPGNLKLWAVPNAQSPESAEWIQNVFRTDKELTEFCRLAGIVTITDYQDKIFDTNGKFCDELKQFILQRIPQIAFRLGKERGCRTQAQAFAIVDDLYDRLNALKYCILPEPEDGREGHMKLKNGSLYCFSNWRSQTEKLGKWLTQYLTIESKCEKSSFKSALSHDSKPRQPSEIDFLKACENGCANRLGGGTPTTPLTEPVPPPPPILPPGTPDTGTPAGAPPGALAGAPQGVPPGTPPKTPAEKKREPWSPATDATAFNVPSPPQSLPEPKTPPLSRGASEGNPKSGKTPKTNGEKEGLTEQEKKQMGQWAEKHFFAWYTERKILMKKQKYDYREVPTDIPGMRRLTGTLKQISIEILWLNSPARRPPGQEQDELWDSRKDHDLEIRTQSEGKIKTKHIEIKGTRGANVHFFISKNEYQAMQQPKTLERDNYRLYVITKVGEAALAFVTPILDLNKLRLVSAKYEYSA